jgi:hypothetical protein
MAMIPYTKSMHKWIADSCKASGMSKSELAAKLGVNGQYFAHVVRTTIDENHWNAAVEFFAKKGIVFEAALTKGMANETSVLDRFRALVAAPGASPGQLISMFGITKSVYYNIVKNKPSSRPTIEKLAKVFAKADAGSVAKTAVKTKKAAMPQSAAIGNIGAAIRLGMDLQALLGRVTDKKMAAAVMELFAHKA